MSGKTDVPKEVLAISEILQSMNVTDYDGLVVEMLLEFFHRYTTDILNESMLVSTFAGRNGVIDIQDVKIALKGISMNQFVEPPGLDFLLELAAEKNKEGVKIVKNSPNIMLPPKKHCLSERNYNLQFPPPTINNPTPPPPSSK